MKHYHQPTTESIEMRVGQVVCNSPGNPGGDPAEGGAPARKKGLYV